MSLGWADNVLLAMGPLGILTTVASAIRVSGHRKLKAIIGRARESLAAVEVELLSSTSNRVCELWNGTEIVRAVGQPEDMKEFVILKDDIGPNDVQVDHDSRILDLNQAVRTNFLLAQPELHEDEQRQIISRAPNITLNIAGSTSSQAELWFWAIVGVVLQTTALALPGVTAYLWKWHKGQNPVPHYAYPCFLSGSLAIIIGMLSCSHIIEATTKEREFSHNVHEHPRNSIRYVLRLQKSCMVSEQHFPSYAIFNDPGHLAIRTSRLEVGNESRRSFLAVISTMVTVFGFISQFIGLRALHWSATIIQLGVALAMTCVRAWVRQGLALEPTYLPIDEGHESAWLALFVLADELSDDETVSAFQLSKTLRTWELFTGTFRKQMIHRYLSPSEFRQPEPMKGEYRTMKVIGLHMRLCKSMGQSSETFKWSSRLCAAVEGMMKHLWATKDIRLDRRKINESPYLNWSVKILDVAVDPTVEVGPMTHSLIAGIKLQPSAADAEDEENSTVWKVDPLEMYSILALWIYALEQRENKLKVRVNQTAQQTRTDFNQEAGASLTTTQGYIRVLGRLSPENLARHSREQNPITDWLEAPIAAINKFTNIDSICPIDNCHHWPVFGMYMRKRSLQHSEIGQNYKHIVVRNEHTLHQACAVEILSFFISIIASRISVIGGYTRSEPKPRFELETTILSGLDAKLEPSETLWTNTAINALSNCIVNAGLVGNLTEANTILLPTLFDYGLLPTGCGENNLDDIPQNVGNENDNSANTSGSIPSDTLAMPPSDGSANQNLTIQEGEGSISDQGSTYQDAQAEQVEGIPLQDLNRNISHEP